MKNKLKEKVEKINLYQILGKFKNYLLRPHQGLRKYNYINLKDLSPVEFNDFTYNFNKYINSFKYKIGIFISYKFPEYLNKRKRNKIFKELSKYDYSCIEFYNPYKGKWILFSLKKNKEVNANK